MLFSKFNNYVICTLLVFKVFSQCETSKKIVHDSLLQLAYDKREFSSYESLVLNPKQDMFAYCVTHNSNKPCLAIAELAIATPMSKIGSRIYITKLDTKTSFEVGSPYDNNWLPSWSPDGTTLSYFSDANAKPEIWLYDLKKNKSFQLSSERIRSDISELSRSIWSPDGEKLYVQLVPKYIETELVKSQINPKKIRVYESKKNLKNNTSNENEEFQNLSNKFFSSDLAEIDVKTKKVKILAKSNVSESINFMRLSPAGNWLSFNSTSLVPGQLYCMANDLFIMNIKSNKKQLIEKNIQSRYGQLNYIWNPKEDTLAYIKDGKLFLVELDKNGLFKKRQLGTQKNLVATPFAFSNDGKNIIVGASDSKADFLECPSELLYISLDNEDIIRIPLHKDWLFKSAIKCDEKSLWQPNGNTITFIASDSLINKDLLVRISFDNIKVINECILWQKSASISRITPLKNNSILSLYEDFNTPQNIYLFNKNFSSKQKITSIDPRLDSLKGFTKKNICNPVTLADEKTKNVNTTIVFPQHYKNTQKLPALVVIYPGSNCSNLAKNFAGGDLISIPNFLFLKAGYVLIFPDISMGAEGEGASGNPLQEMVDILLPQIYHANQLGYIDINHLGIIGLSYGGYGTAGIIAKTSLFKAAVAISGIYDLAGNYGYLGNDDGSFNRLWSECGQARMGTHPWKDLQRYLNNSPYYLADKIKTPLLLIHGEKDYSNYVEAEKMFSALRRLEKVAQLAIYPGQEHTISTWEHYAAIDAYKRMLKFLKDYL